MVDNEKYDDLALYRYSDHSTDWLNCKVEKKFPKKNKHNVEIQNKNECSYFGVKFQKFPNSNIIF